MKFSLSFLCFGTCQMPPSRTTIGSKKNFVVTSIFFPSFDRFHNMHCVFIAVSWFSTTRTNFSYLFTVFNFWIRIVVLKEGSWFTGHKIDFVFIWHLNSPYDSLIQKWNTMNRIFNLNIYSHRLLISASKIRGQLR